MTKSGDADQQQKQTRKYQKINKEERRVVLKLLINDKLSLQEVANRLKLKYCTVRTIQKAYEKDGRIGKKETRKKKLKIENILKISILNPFTFQLSEPIVSSEVSQISNLQKKIKQLQLKSSVLFFNRNAKNFL
ncbi:unnamed protein product [Paramecium sonneborni]|uniref:Uncharacterized protein n=1 Tax=Paramecium sonneborni TaxID=65129 RepID=A0A8S1PKZ3_9CILI|nr:unnamed protein product [Paramecium sonneborni]